MSGAIQKDKLTAIVDRLRSGATALIKESLDLGFTHNGPLRSALKALLGEQGYNELMQSKRPVTKSGAPLSSVPRERPDDSGLPLLQSMGKTDGWTWRHVSEHEPRPVKVLINKGQKDEGTVTVNDAGERLIVVISPEGKEYIKAFEYEKADLLRVNPSSADSPPLRFVEYGHSEWKKKIDKNVEQGTEQLERGEAALERKKAKNNGEAPPTIIEASKAPKKSRPAKKMTDAEQTARRVRDHEVVAGAKPKAVKKVAKAKKK